ncbi:MAG: Aminotransferase NifS [Gammaproteobacteria bacterium]|nr:Aminotransferase NifS [Gammaproteobacteria bacterium]
MPKPLYFDYAATTPVDPTVCQKMQECLSREGDFGNAASVHYYGLAANHRIEEARQSIANIVNAEPQQIIFTSGATEANNLAIKGLAHAYQSKGKHIITSQVEHKSVLEPCQYLERQGFSLTYLPVMANGLLDIEQLKAAIRPDTILISIIQVNNELGTIQNLTKITQIAHEHGIFVHSDAAQSIGKIKIDIKSLQVDSMSLSAHKSYGPKGIGALFLRKPLVKLQPITQGGGHEYGLRPGTLATHQIVGMAEAFKIAEQKLADETVRIQRLKQMLWQGLQGLPGVKLNADLEHAVPHILNVCFSQIEGELLYNSLQPALAIAAGAACDSTQSEPSHVLKALGLSRDLAESSIRFSLGRYTTEQDILAAIKAVKSVILPR